MQLSTVVVFGLVALAGSEVYSSRHYGAQNQQGDNTQTYNRYAQNNGNHGLDQNQYQGDQAYNRQSNYNNQDESNERTLYNRNQQYNNQGQNDQYSESNWNVQSSRNSNNNQNNNQANRQWRSQTNNGPLNRQNSEEYINQQQQLNKKNQRNQNYASSFDVLSSSSVSDESNYSQEDYVKEQQSDNNDMAYETGRKVAEKMVKIYGIFEKFAARNGTVQIKQAQEPLALRQWALPMPQHHFLNMNDSKVYGLNQGIIKSLYVNTDRNCVDLEYYFENMQVQGNMKASMGPKHGSFHLKMTNTHVNVSTELENHNRNFAHSRAGKIDISYKNMQESAVDSQSMNEPIESTYVQFVNRAIESEMIDNSYNGLVKCLRSEIATPFKLPSYIKHNNMLVVNKKSQLSVSLKTQILNEGQTDEQPKIQSVSYRQSKSGDGYKLKVKIVLAKRASWESEVSAQKVGQHVTITNVRFEAEQIVAYAVMERMQQNGENRFNIKDAHIKLEGLKFDIGKFNLAHNENEQLARETGQNMQKILENGMSVALKKQLYQQQQICEQNVSECIRCEQYNN